MECGLNGFQSIRYVNSHFDILYSYDVSFAVQYKLKRFQALHGGIAISFLFAVTVYLNYREAEVQVLKGTLSHNSYLDCR